MGKSIADFNVQFGSAVHTCLQHLPVASGWNLLSQARVLNAVADVFYLVRVEVAAAEQRGT